MISVPVMSRRHQVGRELDAVELQVDGLGDGADHERLGQARHADHQAVAAGEQGRQQVIDDVLLADDDLGDLFLELLARLAEAGDGLQVAGACAGGAGHQRVGLGAGCRTWW